MGDGMDKSRASLELDTAVCCIFEERTAVASGECSMLVRAGEGVCCIRVSPLPECMPDADANEVVVVVEAEFEFEFEFEADSPPPLVA